MENYDSLKDQLCEQEGKNVPITINNWYWGGNRHWSGIRLPDSSDYKVSSQHPYGRAGDSINPIVPAEEIRQRIERKEIILPHPATFEVNTAWLHMDTRQSLFHVTFVNLTMVVLQF